MQLNHDQGRTACLLCCRAVTSLRKAHLLKGEPQFQILISYIDTELIKASLLCQSLDFLPKKWQLQRTVLQQATKTVFIIALKYLKEYPVEMGLDLSRRMIKDQ